VFYIAYTLQVSVNIVKPTTGLLIVSFRCIIWICVVLVWTEYVWWHCFGLQTTLSNICKQGSDLELLVAGHIKMKKWTVLQDFFVRILGCSVE